MPQKRTTYMAQFKLQAVKLITEQKLSVAEAVRGGLPPHHPINVAMAKLVFGTDAVVAGVRPKRSETNVYQVARSG